VPHDEADGRYEALSGSGFSELAATKERHPMNKNINTPLVIIGTVIVVLLVILVFGGGGMMTGGMMHWWR
jgi:hypothetical protein